MQKKYKVLIGIIAVILAAILVLPLFIDLNQYKPVILNIINKKIDRSVSIDGSINLRILPNPHIVIHDVKVASIPNTKDPFLADIESINVDVKLWPLLHKNFQINEITLNNGKISLEKSKDQQKNWDIKIKDDPDKIDSNKINNLKSNPGQASHHSVEKIRLNNCQINYIDQGNHTQFEGINLIIKFDVDQGSLEIDGTSKFKNDEIKFLGHLGNRSIKTPFDITITTMNQEISAEGFMNYDILDAQGKMKLKGLIKDFISADFKCPPELQQPYKITSQFTFEKNKFDFSDVKVSWNNIIGDGLGSYKLDTGKLYLRVLLNPGKIEIAVDSDNNTSADSNGIHAKIAVGDFNLLLKTCGIDTENIPEKIGTDKRLNFTVTQVNNKIVVNDLAYLDSNKQIIGGMIDYEVNQDKTNKLTYNLSCDNFMKLAEILNYDDIDITEKMLIQGETLINESSYQIKTMVQIGTSKITGDGKIDKANNQTESNFKCQASGDNLKQLLKVLFKDSDPVNLDKFDIALDVNQKDNKINLEQFKGMIQSGTDTINLQGSAELTSSANKSQFKADLTLSELNLDKILTKDLSNKNKIKSKSSIVSGPKGFVPQYSGHWSHDPINLKFLQNIEGRFTIKCADFTYLNLPTKNLEIPITITNGILHVKNLSGVMYDGHVNADLLISSQNTQGIKLKADIVNARFKNMDAVKKGMIYIKDGLMNAHIDLSTEGSSEFDYIKNLGGSVMLKATQGVINGFDMQKISDNLNKAKTLSGLGNLFNMAFTGGSTNFDELVLSLIFDHGVGRIDKLLMEASNIDAKGAGKIHLPNYSYNVSGVVRLTAVDNLPPFKVYVTGPLDNPNFNIDKSELTQYFVDHVFTGILKDIGNVAKAPGNSVKAVLNGLLGNSQSSSSSQDQSTQSTQSNDSSSLKQNLKSALKDLF